jgi:hypothetical protein
MGRDTWQFDGDMSMLYEGWSSSSQLAEPRVSWIIWATWRQALCREMSLLVTSNPIGLHNEHSLFQRISIHLHCDVKASKLLASLLTAD